MTEKKPFPGFWQSVLLLTIILIIQLVLYIPFILLNLSGKVDMLSNPAVLGSINFISIGIIILTGKYIKKTNFFELYPLKKINWIQLSIVVITSVGMAIVLTDLDTLVRIAIPMPEFIEKIFMDLIANQDTFIASIITVVLVAAFTEEYLFRGLFLNGYEKRYGSTKAIIFTALLFGLFHGNPWQFFGAVILGAIYAWWFIRTRNITLCVIGHGLNNLMSLMGAQYLSIKGYSDELSAEPEFQPMWLRITGIIISAAGIWLTIRYLKPKKEKATQSDTLSG